MHVPHSFKRFRETVVAIPQVAAVARLNDRTGPDACYPVYASGIGLSDDSARVSLVPRDEQCRVVLSEDDAVQDLWNEQAKILVGLRYRIV